ncbi:hypothetical protein [Treponema sp. R6D11]
MGYKTIASHKQEYFKAKAETLKMLVEEYLRDLEKTLPGCVACPVRGRLIVDEKQFTETKIKPIMMQRKEDSVELSSNDGGMNFKLFFDNDGEFTLELPVRTGDKKFFIIENTVAKSLGTNDFEVSRMFSIAEKLLGNLSTDLAVKNKSQCQFSPRTYAIKELDNHKMELMSIDPNLREWASKLPFANSKGFETDKIIDCLSRASRFCEDYDFGKKNLRSNAPAIMIVPRTPIPDAPLLKMASLMFLKKTWSNLNVRDKMGLVQRYARETAKTYKLKEMETIFYAGTKNVGGFVPRGEMCKIYIDAPRLESSDSLKQNMETVRHEVHHAYQNAVLYHKHPPLPEDLVVDKRTGKCNVDIWRESIGEESANKIEELLEPSADKIEKTERLSLREMLEDAKREPHIPCEHCVNIKKTL